MCDTNAHAAAAAAAVSAAPLFPATMTTAHSTHSLTHAHDTQVELHTVASTILQLPRIEDPSDADVAQWHSKYMDHLEALFERHKGRFGYADRKLEML